MIEVTPSEDLSIIQSAINVNKTIEILNLVNNDNFFEKLEENPNIKLNDKLLEKIQQVQTLKQQLRGFTQDLDNRQKQLKKIVDIQTRLRENIRSLEKVKSDKLIAR